MQMTLMMYLIMYLIIQSKINFKSLLHYKITSCSYYNVHKKQNSIGIFLCVTAVMNMPCVYCSAPFEAIPQ